MDKLNPSLLEEAGNRSQRSSGTYTLKGSERGQVTGKHYANLAQLIKPGALTSAMRTQTKGRFLKIHLFSGTPFSNLP